jgi:plasmid maintenance system antidote protein VapI
MEQLHLSNYDVAVSLGCTIERVRDFITGVRAPTELHIAELALLLGVTQESLATAAKREIESSAVAV